MTNNFATVWGECAPWPLKADLVRYLRDGGLDVLEDDYSLRIEGRSDFVIKLCCGECGDKTMIDANSDSPEVLLHETRLVSFALAAADIKHRLEVYDSNDDLLAYLHHNWSREA